MVSFFEINTSLYENGSISSISPHFQNPVSPLFDLGDGRYAGGEDFIVTPWCRLT
jgi:hypothetical protein